MTLSAIQSFCLSMCCLLNKSIIHVVILRAMGRYVSHMERDKKHFKSFQTVYLGNDRLVNYLGSPKYVMKIDIDCKLN